MSLKAKHQSVVAQRVKDCRDQWSYNPSWPKPYRGKKWFYKGLVD
jgi:hypothetical protein